VLPLRHGQVAAAALWPRSPEGVEDAMPTRNWYVVIAFLAALGLGPMLAACNTIEDAGKDTPAAGQTVSGTAKDTKETLRAGRMRF
jgi:predicted small secreted protein